MSQANNAVKVNRNKQRYGHGIFGKPTGNSSLSDEQPFQLPIPTKSTRERFAEEARTHQRRERTIWLGIVLVTLLLAYLYYVYGYSTWRFTSIT